jgi:hypothetical protein
MALVIVNVKFPRLRKEQVSRRALHMMKRRFILSEAKLRTVSASNDIVEDDSDNCVGIKISSPECTWRQGNANSSRFIGMESSRDLNSEVVEAEEIRLHIHRLHRLDDAA